jgi:hypothetical protein
MGTYLEHATTKNRPIRLGEVVRGGSWLALVAETTPGMGSVVCHRVQVRCSDLHDGQVQRLIVQAYARKDIGTRGLPWPGARPLASCQREVDAAELKRGVEVGLVHLTSEPEVMLVAWAELGTADLEFDALRSRPGVADPIGSAVSGSGERVELLLRSASSDGARAA